MLYARAVLQIATEGAYDPVEALNFCPVSDMHSWFDGLLVGQIGVKTITIILHFMMKS